MDCLGVRVVVGGRMIRLDSLKVNNFISNKKLITSHVFCWTFCNTFKLKLYMETKKRNIKKLFDVVIHDIKTNAVFTIYES